MTKRIELSGRRLGRLVVTAYAGGRYWSCICDCGARVVVRGLEAILEDLGSRHGSWLGTTPVRGVVRLASGDEITLGTASLVYCLTMPDDTTRD